MEVYGSEEVISFIHILVRDSERLSGILANRLISATVANEKHH